MEGDNNITENPFPRQAVATFGTGALTTENFSYMLNAESELNSYFAAHPLSNQRFGGGLGLKGGHGYGKTHLLMWLAKKAHQLTTADATVCYAKADTASFFDLFISFMFSISRERITFLIEKALKNVAFDEVRRARATESLKNRLKGPAALKTLYKEGNLDAELLLDLLAERLIRGERSITETDNSNYTFTSIEDIPDELPRVLLKVDGSEFGQNAYRWLKGDTVPELKSIGVNSTLQQFAENKIDRSASDVIAIYALETIAALHEIAETPLLLFVDQLEILLSGDSDRIKTLYSLLKKFVEQIGSHYGFIILAGTDEAWRSLRRDVGPRLRTREPLKIGQLNQQEIKLLLCAYCPDWRTIRNNQLKNFYALSGGSPREILRIAHRAFENTKGQLKEIDDTVLVISARDSESIEDRRKLALEIVERVFGEYGEVFPPHDLGDEIIIDRMVFRDGIPWIAIVTIGATDRLMEIDSARQVSQIKKCLEQRWPGTDMLVISIGYSSEQVRTILEAAFFVLSFEETTFENQLRTYITTISLKKVQNKETAPYDDTTFLELLKKISNRLDNLETKREDEEHRVLDRVSEATVIASEPQIQNRQAETRWELINQLDRLEDALLRNDTGLERELIRGMLIGNEANLKLQEFDFLGDLYLDLVGKVRILDIPDRKDSEYYEFYSNKVIELKKRRARILPEMRRTIRPIGFIDKLLEKPFLSASILAVAASFGWFLLKTFLYRIY